MATQASEFIIDTKSSMSGDRSSSNEGNQPPTSSSNFLEKHNILNETLQEEQLDEEVLRKKNENKLKYRRLKQKLAALSSEPQDKCLFKTNKQVSSSNKHRLLTLAIQFEKMTLNQTKDYNAIENKLKEIYKILDFKLECDLSTLKLSRFIPAFSALLKRVPAFHKNQFSQSVKTIQLGLKVLRIFSTISANRDYMILTNQLSTLNSCLSSFITKEQKKLAIQCLNVILELLCGKIKVDSEQIVSVTFQIIFMGQLGRKLRQTIDLAITQDGVFDEQYIIKCLKYLFVIYKKTFQKYLERPIYQQHQIPAALQYHIDALISQVLNILPIMVLDKQQGGMKEDNLPICHINILLYLLKLLNICIHASNISAQKIIQLSEQTHFSQTIKLLHIYSRNSIQQNTSNHEIQSIYSQLIQFYGKICCGNSKNKKGLASTGLLDLFYDHPIRYIMDNKLKSLLIPSLCSVINDEQSNMKKYLSESSADSIITFILQYKKKYEQSQMKYRESQLQNFAKYEVQQGQQEIKTILSRKESVSSLNSYTTQCTQSSYLHSNEEERFSNSLIFLIPYGEWEELVRKLQSLDC